jgi:DNA polymerase zeta
MYLVIGVKCSLQVQAESRGDLRPNPRFDAINVVVLAFQNDGDSAVEVHVLLCSKSESCQRYEFQSHT